MSRFSVVPVEQLIKTCLDSNSKFLLPPIGPFQALYLLAVVKLGETHAYGRMIRAFFAETYKRPDVNIGQIYGTAAALVAQGLLRSESVPNPHGQGRPVIVYVITKQGAAILEAAQTYFAAVSEQSDQEKRSDAQAPQGVSNSVQAEEQGHVRSKNSTRSIQSLRPRKRSRGTHVAAA